MTFMEQGAIPELLLEVNGPGNETLRASFAAFLFRSSIKISLAWRSRARDLSQSRPHSSGKNCIVASQELSQTYAKGLRVALDRFSWVAIEELGGRGDNG